MSASALEDSGSGSALASITAATTALGSAAIVSQLAPTKTNVPTTAYPAYGAATSMSQNSLVLIVVIGILALGGLLFAMKG